MRMELLNYGDEVSFLCSEYIAINRASGECVIIPVINDGGKVSLDIENLIEITYKDMDLCVENHEGVTVIDF